jgi:hypothetical protein
MLSENEVERVSVVTVANCVSVGVGTQAIVAIDALNGNW